MKKFDFSQFTHQLTLSRKADDVLSNLSTLDKLVKFALQHCEYELDYDNLSYELSLSVENLESFIKTHICYEHTESHSSTTCTPTDN